MKHTIFRLLVAATAIINICIHANSATAEGEENIKYYPAIGVIEEEKAEEIIARLKGKGYIIYNRRHELALILIPAEELTGLNPTIESKARRKSGTPDLTEVEISLPFSPTLDKARTRAGAIRLQTGEGLSLPLDGTGTVTGFCDIGIDVTHPTFNDREGNSRIRRFTVYDEYQGIRNEYSTPADIAAARTDNADKWHGTHVGGILAGSGYDTPYRGLAYNADIVCSGSRLSSVGLLAGAEDIIGYAKEAGKPCVINLSMANYTGPHDGTGLFSRYLAYMAEDAVIVISAGNEGATTHTLSHTFTAENPEIRVRLNNSDWTNYHLNGETDLWNLSDDSFIFQFFLYYYGGEQYSFPEVDFSKSSFWSISSDPHSEWYDATFAENCTGVLEAHAGTSTENGRFNVILTYDLTFHEADPLSLQNPAGTWAKFNPAISIRAREGVHTDVYADVSSTWLKQWSGYQKPGASLNDLITGEGVIGVGMYNNREDYPLLAGGTSSVMCQTPGEPTTHSSYATLSDGRVLPHTVAPGNVLISAANGAYIEKYPEEEAFFCAKSNYNGSTVYWGADGGTSMSSPYVAGCIALWMQVFPDINWRDALDYIIRSNTAGTVNPEDPRWGQGAFQPYEAFRLMASEMGTGGVLPTEENALRLEVQGNLANIYNPGGGRVDIKICDMTGRMLFAGSKEGILFSTDLKKLSGLTDSILILSLTSETGSRISKKIFVR